MKKKYTTMHPFEVTDINRERNCISEEYECHSDSSLDSVGKRVTFKVQKDSENNTKDGNCKLKHKSKRSNWSKLSISREDIPDGSDVFRQVLQEIENDSRTDDEVETPRSVTGKKPLKSILKKSASCDAILGYR